MEKIILKHRTRKTKDLYAITCNDCNHVYVAKSKLKKCPKCKIINRTNSYHLEKTEKRGKCNGYGGHPLNLVWHGIIYRCHKENHAQYKNYGARGIKVCDKWRNSFDSFFKWALENGWEYGKGIDRINNDGNYNPENCRFVCNAINNRNQRRHKNNTSGYTGVFYHKINKRWISYIHADGVNITIGMFDDLKEAVNARNDFIKQYNLSGFILQ